MKPQSIGKMSKPHSFLNKLTSAITLVAFLCIEAAGACSECRDSLMRVEQSGRTSVKTALAKALGIQPQLPLVEPMTVAAKYGIR